MTSDRISSYSSGWPDLARFQDCMRSASPSASRSWQGWKKSPAALWTHQFSSYSASLFLQIRKMFQETCQTNVGFRFRTDLDWNIHFPPLRQQVRSDQVHLGQKKKPLLPPLLTMQLEFTSNTWSDRSLKYFCRLYCSKKQIYIDFLVSNTTKTHDTHRTTDPSHTRGRPHACPPCLRTKPLLAAEKHRALTS